MKQYRPSPPGVHQEKDYNVLQHKARSKIGKRVHQVAHQGSTGLKESPYMSSRMLKRSSPYSSTVLEAHTGNTQKVKALEVEGKRRKVQPISFLRKVDNVAYLRENLGEKFTHRSSYNGLSGYGYLDRAKLDIAGSSEQNDSDDDASSVGSCSVNTMPFAAPCQDRELDPSDAESCCYSLEEEDCGFHNDGKNVEGHIWKHASLLSCLQSFEGDAGSCLINFVVYAASAQACLLFSQYQPSFWLREVTDFCLQLLHTRLF